MKLDTIKPESIRTAQEAEEEQPSLSEELLKSVVGGVGGEALALGCCRYRYKLATLALDAL